MGIHIRLAMPAGSALHPITGKFGANTDEAVDLIRKAQTYTSRIGVCFHVGSQTMDPLSFEQALDFAGQVIARSGYAISVLNIGGGFPVAYPDIQPPPLSSFFDAIDRGIGKLNLPANCEIICEPGRALASPAETLIVRVELRKGDTLYINDGGYGTLFDGMLIGQRWPARLIRPHAPHSPILAPFKFYGPTCDSLDCIEGPFFLPDDIAEGDWIAIEQQGAYCSSMQSHFNGFFSDTFVEIRHAHERSL